MYSTSLFSSCGLAVRVDGLGQLAHVLPGLRVVRLLVRAELLLGFVAPALHRDHPRRRRVAAADRAGRVHVGHALDADVAADVVGDGREHLAHPLHRLHFVGAGRRALGGELDAVAPGGEGVDHLRVDAVGLGLDQRVDRRSPALVDHLRGQRREVGIGRLAARAGAEPGLVELHVDLLQRRVGERERQRVGGLCRGGERRELRLLGACVGDLGVDPVADPLGLEVVGRAFAVGLLGDRGRIAGLAQGDDRRGAVVRLVAGAGSGDRLRHRVEAHLDRRRRGLGLQRLEPVFDGTDRGRELAVLRLDRPGLGEGLRRLLQRPNRTVGFVLRQRLGSDVGALLEARQRLGRLVGVRRLRGRGGARLQIGERLLQRRGLGRRRLGGRLRRCARADAVGDLLRGGEVGARPAHRLEGPGPGRRRVGHGARLRHRSGGLLQQLGDRLALGLHLLRRLVLVEGGGLRVGELALAGVRGDRRNESLPERTAAARLDQQARAFLDFQLVVAGESVRLCEQGLDLGRAVLRLGVRLDGGDVARPSSAAASRSRRGAGRSAAREKALRRRPWRP